MHGAGRAGRDAWPQQDGAGAFFADHSAQASMTDKARLVGEQCPPGEVVVVAHSLGAVPVALAHRTGQITASAVVLVEPALYDVARANPAVEHHVRVMTSARQRAGAGDLFGHWELVAPLMFGREASRETWYEDEPLARFFAELDPPWGHGIDAAVFAAVPTLVVTGDWNDEYEAIAGALAGAGARHVRLAGHRHRPQDHPDFEAVLADVTRTGPRAPSRRTPG